MRNEFYICQHCRGRVIKYNGLWYHNEGVDGNLVMPCCDGKNTADPIPDRALRISAEEPVDGTCRHCGVHIINLGNDMWVHLVSNDMYRTDCYEMLSLTKAQPIDEGYLVISEEIHEWM